MGKERREKENLLIFCHMNRKSFIKTSLKALSATTLAPLLIGSEKLGHHVPEGEACILTPRETAGPFPTKNPAAFQFMDIRGDREGVSMELVLTIQDRRNNCQPLEGAIVDIWHCDKDGHYSEYGGMRMQREDFTEAHFLRGRQITDADGNIGFQTIFPGWYPGRPPHIHVEIFNTVGRSVLITQVAFPKPTCDHVYTHSELYTQGLQDTTNERDGIFRDSIEHEMATLTGNLEEGYRFSHTIVVES